MVLKKQVVTLNLLVKYNMNEGIQTAKSRLYNKYCDIFVL